MACIYRNRAYPVICKRSPEEPYCTQKRPADVGIPHQKTQQLAVREKRAQARSDKHGHNGPEADGGGDVGAVGGGWGECGFGGSADRDDSDRYACEKSHV